MQRSSVCIKVFLFFPAYGYKKTAPSHTHGEFLPLSITTSEAKDQTERNVEQPKHIRRCCRGKEALHLESSGEENQSMHDQQFIQTEMIKDVWTSSGNSLVLLC
jgi:hypothetical protein